MPRYCKPISNFYCRMFGTNLEDVMMEKKMERLARKFPKIWFKDGGEFSPDHVGTIWTGEGSSIGDEGQWEAFDYYGYDSTFGVHPKLAHVLENMGLYAEFYDAGTVFFYKK